MRELEERLVLSEEERMIADNLLEEALLSLVELENKAEQTKEIIRDKENEIVTKKLELSSMQGSRKSEDERHVTLVSDISSLTSSIELLKERSAKTETTLNGYRKKAEEAAALAKAEEEKASKLEAKIKELTDSANTLYIDMASKKQRAEALRRMEEHFEGYANSVRFIMNESSNGNLSGVYGPVSKLITVERKYTLAIETALGGSLQNIVVKDEQSAKKAISLLKEKNAGRATFYPLTSIRPQLLNIDMSRLTNISGYIGIANELTACDEIFKPINDYLLAKTVIFDNIDNASVAAKQFGYKFKIVTLDGQVINAGGSYTGGSAKKDSGMLTRVSEIERLDAECKKLSNEADELHKKADKLNKEKEEAIKNRDSHQGNSTLLNSLLNAENTQYEVLKAQIASDEKALADLKDEISRLEKSEDFYMGKKQEVEIELDNFIAFINEKTELLEKQKAEIDAKNAEIEILRQRNSDSVVRLAEDKKDTENMQKAVISAEVELKNLDERIVLVNTDFNNLNTRQERAAEKLKNTRDALAKIKEEITELEKNRGSYTERNDELEKKINDLRTKLKDKTNERELTFRAYTKLEGLCQQLKNDLDKSSERIWDEYELTYSAVALLELPEITPENRNETFRTLTEYKSKLRSLGHVNVNAIDEYKEVKERYDFMHGQISDLENAGKQLNGIIEKLELEMRDRFTNAMKDINMHFKTVFRELFGGGTAELVLTNPDDVLTSGIDINVAPPGKIIKNLVSLSGGEQAFVAIALFFAILKVNPTPFCIFDEIESALDEVNVIRFAEYARKYSDATQFIMITHRRGTMESADTLYGVTMYEKGISKVLTVNVKDIEDKLGVNLE